MKKLVLILTLIGALFACQNNKTELVVFSGPTMGTVYQVKFTLDDIQQARIDTSALEIEIVETLKQVNQLMSTYISSSELSRLNKAPAAVPFAISDETAFVLQEAIRLNKISEGALDVTVGPLVNLWGFGPEAKPDMVPTDDELRQIKEVIGIDKFKLANNTVIKSHPDVYIDLSTIAKGYAVDRLAKMLEANNIGNYLVDIGGEMRVSGKKQNNKDWLIAIEKPVSTERSAQTVIVIGNNAIATSGDYRNYFEEDGVRYSHLIDPTTGRPIKHNLVAVSVVNPSSMTADGLATALIVLGKKRGLEVANKEQIAALFIVKEGDKFVEYKSSSFDDTVQVMK